MIRSHLRILGLDPGSRLTGYGVIELASEVSSEYRYVTSGCIKLPTQDLGSKLLQIYQQIFELTKEYSPQEVAIERVFVKKNSDSAIKLGQARGAAIAAALSEGARLAEYTPREIKQAIVGYGGAEKTQVQQMVKLILKLDQLAAGLDESDALAIAICHAHTRSFNFFCNNYNHRHASHHK